MVIKKNGFLLALLLIAHSVLATPLTVHLDWLMGPDHAPILLAMSDGYFKKNGLEVELIQPSDPSDGPKLIAAGKGDIAITYQPRYLRQIKQGLPVIQIGTLVPTPLECLIYLPGSGINSPKDLKGKRIGYSDASDGFQLLIAVLHAGGLTLKDVTLVNVHYSLTQALMSHKIDAAVDMMRNVQPLILQHYHLSPQMFYPEDFGIPSYSELIYIAHSGTKKAEITAFLKALKESTAALKKDPEGAWKSVIHQYPQLDTTTNRSTWDETVPLFTDDPQDTWQLTQ